MIDRIGFDENERRVAIFAARCHEGQKRKYTGHPYIVHPLRVAAAVKFHDMLPVITGREIQKSACVMAALLHDVLEDTDVSICEIKEFLENNLNLSLTQSETDKMISDVLEMLRALTDVYTKEAYPSYNREKRKSLEAARLRKTSMNTKFIKTLDIKDNLNSIKVYDRKFLKVFMKEKLLLLEDAECNTFKHFFESCSLSVD